MIAEPASEAEADIRLRRTSALLRVCSGIHYDQPLARVLDEVASNIVELTDASSAAVFLLDAVRLSPIAFGDCNVPKGYSERMAELRQLPREADQLRRAIAARQTWVLRGARSVLLSKPEFASMREFFDDISWETVVGTPFLYRPEVIAI